MSANTHDLLDTLDAGSKWTDALLDLFWTLDEVVKRGDILPVEVRESYDRAETARQKL